MLLGLILLYVGAVLFVNSIWLMERISGKEVAVINTFVGSLSLLVALYMIFFAGEVRGGAFTLLFAFTYLWVAANQFLGADGKGLGWFCLFVSITAATAAIQALGSLDGSFGVWNALNWVAWTLLWFTFFLLLGLSRKIQRQVAVFTLVCAIFTGWIPGLLILGQVLKP